MLGSTVTQDLNQDATAVAEAGPTPTLKVRTFLTPERDRTRMFNAF